MRAHQIMTRRVVVHGVIADGRSRNATIVAAEAVAGVKDVHDHLCRVESISGMHLNIAEDEKVANSGTFG